MEIILTQDVEHLGFKEDVVRVKPGYAQNYLIPKGFAELATPSRKKVLAENLKQRRHKEKKVLEEARSHADKLQALDLTLSARTQKGGVLFGSITSTHLSTLFAEHDILIDKKFILISGGSVKRTGEYKADVRFHREIVVTVLFKVISTNS